MLITGFIIDDVNEDKFTAHGISVRQVLQVLEDWYVVVRNRAGRRAPHLLIGRDYGGACITIPIEPTADPTIWRPVTAWPCSDEERARLG